MDWLYFAIPVALVALVALLLLKKPATEGEPEPEFLPELTTHTLIKDGDREILRIEGRTYVPYEGETEDGCQYWDWHGRMGDSWGYLMREKEVFPVGELHCLRDGRGDILLAHLPADGWPVDDMCLYLAEGVSLPPLTSESFAYGEIYRAEGEFPDERLLTVGSIREPAELQLLADAWLNGETAIYAEGEHETYRIRLYSAIEPGLYVTFAVFRDPQTGIAFLEGYRFRGTVPLPTGLLGL